MKTKQIIRGSKRKCASCGTIFFDLEKFPIICPNCGASVALQTNVTKRGRPPKDTKNPLHKNKQSEDIIDNETINDTEIENDESTISASEIEDELISEDIQIEDDALLEEEIPIEDEIQEDQENVENMIEIGTNNKEE